MAGATYSGRADGRSMAAWAIAVIVLAAYVGGLALFRRFNPDAPTVHCGHSRRTFKYGSIGSEPANGIPYWIWKVLPEMFPEKLPGPGNGYASFGFVFESGQEMPIGLSRRKVIIPRVGMNCAICHTGTVRDTPDVGAANLPGNARQYLRPAGIPAIPDRLRLGRPLHRRQRGAGDCGAHEPRSVLSGSIYSQAVYQTREALLDRSRRLAFTRHEPLWGPGRVDTFNPYKTVQFNFPVPETAPPGRPTCPRSGTRDRAAACNCTGTATTIRWRSATRARRSGRASRPLPSICVP